MPELKHLPVSERRKIFLFCWKRLPLTWQFWIFFIFSFVIMMILEWVYNSYSVWAAFLGFVIFGLIQLQIVMRIFRAMIKAHFKEGRHIGDG